MMKQINTVPPLKLQLPIWASDKEYVHIHPLHMYFVHEYSIFHYDPFCLTGLWLVCLLRQWAESASCGQYQKCRQLPLRHLSFTHTPAPYPHEAYRPQLLILVSNWSGISSPHFELAFGRRRARRRKTRVEESASVFSTVMPLSHVCPAIFKGNCMIMTLTIFIYIYIISVVCYETVKFWLWDKKDLSCLFCFFHVLQKLPYTIHH